VTRPGRWGNPYDVRIFGRTLAMKLFRETVQSVWNPELIKAQSDGLCRIAFQAHHTFLKRLGAHPLEIIGTELGGRNLACYCALPKPGEADVCHAAIELEFANKG
jgi:Domain of unknown function (DUF4326)